MRVTRLPSAVYSVLTAAFLGGGLAYLALPADTLVHVFSMPACPLVAIGDWVFLWRSLGASLLLLPTWTYSLKVLLCAWFGSPAPAAPAMLVLHGPAWMIRASTHVLQPLARISSDAPCAPPSMG